MSKIFNTKVIIISILAIIILMIISFFLFPSKAVTYIDNNISPLQVETGQIIEKPKETAKHINTPDSVKTIYMTACAASTESFRTSLTDIIDNTEINSIIIDIKDYTGTIAFNSDNPKLQAGMGGKGCKVPDMKELVEHFHKRNVYVIARLTVFQDPLYANQFPSEAVQNKSNGAVWKDHKGLSFVDVGSRQFHDYIIEIAKEAYDMGFDEINFDYIRYPSDGNIDNAHFPKSYDVVASHGKSEALRRFFEYLYDQLKDTEIVTSADLFGMTTTNTDDLNIGQVLEKALPYFDYIAPMVYPSHYPPNFNGWADPNLVVYDLIHYVMGSAVDRVEAYKNATTTVSAELRDRVSTEQLRTWIQDFDYGGDYGPKEVRDQIQATYDVGLDSWMIWDPSNRYTRSALLPE